LIHAATVHHEARAPRRFRNCSTSFADVEHYPKFVPLCQSLTVRRRIKEDSKDVIVADMTVAYKMIRETFTSAAADGSAGDGQHRFFAGPHAWTQGASPGDPALLLAACRLW